MNMPPASSDNMEANGRNEDNDLKKAEKKAVMCALGIVAGTTTFLLAIIIAFLTGWFTGVLIFGGIPAVLLTFAILHLHLQDNEQRRLAMLQEGSIIEPARGRANNSSSSGVPHLFAINNEAALHQQQLQLCGYFQPTRHYQHCQHCHVGHFATHFDAPATDTSPTNCHDTVPPPAYDSLFPAEANTTESPQDNKQQV